MLPRKIFPMLQFQEPRKALTLITVKFFDQIIIQCVQNIFLSFVVFRFHINMCLQPFRRETVVGLVKIYSHEKCRIWKVKNELMHNHEGKF